MKLSHKMGLLYGLALAFSSDTVYEKPNNKGTHRSSYLGAVDVKIITKRRKKNKLAGKARKRNR